MITTSLSIEQLENLIRQIVKTELEKRTFSIANPEHPKESIVQVKQHPVMVRTKDLCEALFVSRQTLNNWSKNKLTGWLIVPHIKKIGKNLWYDIEAIKSVIEANNQFFGRDRDYHYKYATNEARQRKEYSDASRIERKILHSYIPEITLKEEEFYKRYCVENGRQCLLERIKYTIKKV